MEQNASPTGQEMSIADGLRLLADLRQRYLNTRATIAEMEAALRNEHADLYTASSDLTGRICEVEADIKRAALAEYQDTGNRKPVDGAEVKVFTTYNYDRAEALNWAKDHGMCLKLDDKGFSDLCKSESTRPRFVLVGEDPRVQIATDLSKHIPAGE